MKFCRAASVVLTLRMGRNGCGAAEPRSIAVPPHAEREDYPKKARDLDSDTEHVYTKSQGQSLWRYCSSSEHIFEGDVMIAEEVRETVEVDVSNPHTAELSRSHSEPVPASGPSPQPSPLEYQGRGSEDVSCAQATVQQLPLVHQWPALLDSDVRYSREIQATAVQQSNLKMDVLDEHDSEKPPLPEAILDLPPQTKLGRPGRKPVVTAEVAEQICLLLSIGFSRRQVAAYLGIAPTSITNAVARDPALGEEFRQAEELQGMHPELTILAEARRNWRAAAWYLKYKGNKPRRLTEEEKEERHQEELADLRRKAEIDKERKLNFLREATLRLPEPELPQRKRRR